MTNIFVTHEPTKTAKDFFWTAIKQKVGVGSPRDHDKTTVLQSEHKLELISRIVTIKNMSGEVFCDANDNAVNGEDDESLFSHDSQCVNAINIYDDEGSTGMLEDKHKTMLADSMRKLGNMSRKHIDKYANTDIVKHRFL